MIINKILLENFMPYRKATLSLKQPIENKMVYFIHGENEFGKTSILKAIKWVFYGLEDKKERFDIINDGAIQNGGITKVIIDFADENKNYSLERSLDFDNNITENNVPNEKVTLIIDGKPYIEHTEKTIEDIINSIIPYTASQFYFFDGADISKYAVDDSSNEVKNALHVFLGLDLIDTTISDIENIQKDIESIIRDKSKKKQELDKINQDILFFTDSIKTINDDLLSFNEDRKSKEKIKDSLREQLERSTEGELLQEQINKLQDKINNNKIIIEDYDLKIKEFNAYSYIFIMEKFIKEKIIELKEKEKEYQKCIEKYSKLVGKKELLTEILEKFDTCICGNVINNKSRETLVRILENIKDYKSNLSDYYSKVEENSEYINIFNNANLKLESFNNIDNVYSLKYTKENEVIINNKEMDKLINQQRTCGIISIQLLREQMDKIIQDISDLTSRINICENDKITKLKDIDELKNKRKKYTTIDDDLDLHNMQSFTCDNLINVFNNFSQKFIQYKKINLEKCVNDIYHRVLHAPINSRILKIKNDYTFELFDNKNNILLLRRQSPGGKEVVAFSFIMGLNRYAQKNVPIILDTFTGHLDSEHRKNIAEEITKYERGQVIILVHEADLVLGVNEILKKSVLQEFQIEHDYHNRLSIIKER